MVGKYYWVICTDANDPTWIMFLFAFFMTNYYRKNYYLLLFVYICFILIIILIFDLLYKVTIKFDIIKHIQDIVFIIFRLF